MSEDLNQGTPSTADTAPEPAAPSLSDIASRAIEVANERQSKREAGESVPAELPSVADRTRDEHGKFAPKPKPSAKEPAEAAAPKASPEAVKTEQTPAPEATPAAAPAALQPNPRWSDADKATFARLPQEAQKSVLDMAARQDADYTRKTQEIADQRRAVEPVVAAYNEHAEFLNQRSREIAQPPARILGDMVSLYRQGTTGQPHERAQALGFVAQLFGVDLRALAAGQAQAPQGQVPEPIMRELTQLRQQVGDLNQFRQATQQEREQQSLQTAQQQIDSFATAKDEQGQPKYPHFEAVRGFMAPHVEAGKTFEEAYNLAAKPITDAIAARQQAQDADRQASEAKARAAAEAADKERSAQVDRARRASGPRPTGSKPGMTQSKDLGAITWEAMKKVGLAS